MKADSEFEFVEDFRKEKTKINYLAIVLVSDGMDAEDSCIMKYFLRSSQDLFFFFCISCVQTCDSEGCSQISTVFITVLAGTLCSIKQFHFFKYIYIYILD